MEERKLIRENERLDDLQNGYMLIQDPSQFCFGIDAVLLSWFAKVKPGEQVLDMGTGTGIVPILLKARYPLGKYTGLEIQEESADMARRSVAYNHLEEDISITLGDIKEASGIYGGSAFDVVVSNPPYIEEGDEHLSALKYEPVSALASGSDGLDDIRILAQEASRHLRRDGEVIIEHGYNQADSASELFRAAGFASVRTVHDLGGNPRLCCAKLQAGAPT